MKDFTDKNLYQAKGIRDDGKSFEKISLLFIDDKDDVDGFVLCDCCDEKRPCAHLIMLCNDSAVICKDCLQLIINQF